MRSMKTKKCVIAAVKTSRPPQKRFGVQAQGRFLAHLSETANVSKSAAHAGVAKSLVYAERRKNADFRDGWQKALCEGYTLLETK